MFIKCISGTPEIKIIFVDGYSKQRNMKKVNGYHLATEAVRKEQEITSVCFLVLFTVPN